MRIRELQLIAFGRFADETLDFAADAGRLSIVCGPNEAGKSTALRAISALLFGIPGQTDDAYRHGYAAMRVGAVLERSDGSAEHLVRKKGNKDTLRDADDRAVAEDRLRDLLGGMDRDRFMAAFALDHETLRRGGAELLEGRGDLAESIFAGATGIIGVRKLRQALLEDAAGIWKPRAQSGPLTDALKRCDELRKRRTNDTLTSGKWQEVSVRIAGLERECAGLRERRTALQSDLRGIERRLAAMPKARERASLLEKRAELGDVVLLPSRATSERERAEMKRQQASERAQGASDVIKGLKTKLDALSPTDSWLKAEGSIEGLVGRYGAHAKAMADLPGVLTRAEDARRTAADLLRDVRPGLTVDDAESLRLSLQERERIEALADEGMQLRVEGRAARTECDKADANVTDLQGLVAGLANVSDPSNLRAALQSERDHVANERDLPGLESKREHEAKQVEIEQRRIGLNGRPPQEVEGLPVPSNETIEAFRRRLDQAERDLKEAESGVERARAEIGTASRDIEALRSAGEVPLEADLDEARGRRQAGWALVRTAWLDGRSHSEAERAYDPDRPLAEAYEASVGHADGIADRLRREAERVARLAGLTARKHELEQQLEQAVEDASKRTDALDQARREWAAAWQASGIEPRSPAESQPWLNELNALRPRIANVRDLDRDIGLRRQTVERAREKLIEAVERVAPDRSLGPDDGLAHIVALAEGHVKAMDDAIRKREDAHGRLHQAKSEQEARNGALQDAEKALTTWEVRWREAVAPLGLGEMPEPALVKGTVNTLIEMFGKLKDAEASEKRARDMLDDAARLETDVRALADELPLDSDDREWTDLLAEMQRRLKSAIEDAANRKTWSEQLTEQDGGLKTAQGALAAAESELTRLLQQAQVADRDHLPEAERRSDRAREIAEKLYELERELGRMCGDEDRETFVAEVEVTLKEEAELERVRAEAEISDVESQLSEKLPALGEATSEKKRMDGGSAAAYAAEDEQQALANVRSHTERYVLTRLAAEILTRAVEDMRTRSQGPVMQRAGELFARLTVGRYADLLADFDDKDREVIRGGRADGTRVDVQHMSDGTRDQLFLALRLAATEARTGSEPMPLILDDALINFDDERARAALQVLGELAATTQVLLFTHHTRMLELASGAGVHELRG